LYLRTKLLNFRIVFYWRKVTEVSGVNSVTKDGFHIPMIDTDECSLAQCIEEIRKLQRVYKLGAASICSTGRPDSYHIYIWTKMSWKDAIQVVSSCKIGDLKHLYFSLRRGHFTLRISDKKGRKVKLIEEVVSKYKSNCDFNDLDSFVKYETASKIGVIP
jgi:hypothetical protein